MKIKEMLSYLATFITHLSNSGTTSLLKNVASVKDVYVLTHNEQMKKEFGKSGVSLDAIHNALGSTPKPILVDNYAILQISEKAISEIERLEQEIEYLKKANEKQSLIIHSSLADLKAKKPHNEISDFIMNGLLNINL